MVRGARHRVPFRRRREGRTDYRQRLRLLRGGRPRAVVRKTLRGTIVQFATYEEGGDRIVATAVAKELAKFGWTRPTGNVPAAYLTGYLAGKRALAKGVQEAILDIGLHPARKGSRVFAALKGILDAGVAVPCGEDVLPADDRLRGRHLGDDVPAAVDEAKGEMEGA